MHSQTALAERRGAPSRRRKQLVKFSRSAGTGSRRGATVALSAGARVVAVMLVVVSLVAAALASPAGAVAGYHTSANSIRVRAGASTQTAQINTISNAGTPIDIACQAAGETVTASGFGTSGVWDLLNGYNGFISDLFVQETPYGQFDFRIPRCESQPPPPPAYSTSTTVALRAAPSFNASAIGSVPANAAIAIACQTYGTAVDGSFIWDKVGSGFISDFYVNGTPYNAFDVRLPQCGLGYRPVDCSKVLFLGARCSGEEFGPENLGDANSPVQVTRNLLAQRGASIDVAGTIYPAQSVDILPWDVADYRAGEQQGVAVMLANLRARTDGNVCGWQHTKSVLVGYSQGAMVVSDAVFQMTSLERRTIAGIVTYGNPFYQQGVNGGTGSTGQGLLGGHGSYPDGVSTISRDYCRQDFVCKRGSTNRAEHSRYVNPGPEVANGAAFLAAVLGR
jgi:uncharacterized protein YraI